MRFGTAEIDVTIAGRVSSAALISSSTGNGGVFALFRMCRLVATSSTSPVASSGLDFWRLITLPSTATTNSPRACSALAWACGCGCPGKGDCPGRGGDGPSPSRWRCCQSRRRGERHSSGCVLGCRENLARWLFLDFGSIYFTLRWRLHKLMAWVALRKAPATVRGRYGAYSTI